MSICTLPDDTIRYAVTYLSSDPIHILKSDDESIVNFALINKKLQKSLKKECNEAIERLRTKVRWQALETFFPGPLNAIFRSLSLSIGQFQVLNLSQERQDLINYLTPEKIGNKIVLFEDGFERPGIAIPIEGYADIELQFLEVNGNRNVKKISGVISLYQKAPRNVEKWVIGERHIGVVMGVVHALMARNQGRDDNFSLMTNCSAANFYPFFSNLLMGKDPYFRLVKDAITSTAPSTKVESDEKKDDN